MTAALCIIPAKATSSRIPRKNFTPIVGDQTPVDLAVACCRLLGSVQIVLTTDDTGTWPIGVIGHVQAPHDRMVPVVQDVLRAIPGDDDQPVLLVQPTQPLRQERHLRTALGLLTQVPSVVSVARCATSIDKAYRVDKWGHLDPYGHGVERDQVARPTYYCDGTVYGFRRGWFLTHLSFRHRDTHVFIVPDAETCRLDTPFDWDLAVLRLGATHARPAVSP